MRLSAGCFGKVPIHGDFIRHNVGPEVDRFDEWLQAGIVSSRTALGASWDASFDAMPPQRFLYQSGARVVAGVIASSIDKPGRRYPFLVFTILDPKTLDGDLTALPAILASFMARAEAEAKTGWQGQDLKSFMVRIDSLALPTDFEEAKQSIVKFVAGQTSQVFWSTMFGSDQDPRKYMLIHNLVETLKTGGVPKYALRFPHVTGEAEVSFWLQLCRKLMRRDALPTLSMWGPSREGSSPGMTILYDALKANYYGPFFWPERKSELLFPLADKPAETDTRVQQARGKWGGILDDGAMRLSSLLMRVTSG